MNSFSLRVAYLINIYIRQELTEPEYHELDAWVRESDHNYQILEALTDSLMENDEQFLDE